MIFKGVWEYSRTTVIQWWNQFKQTVCSLLLTLAGKRVLTRIFNHSEPNGNQTAGFMCMRIHFTGWGRGCQLSRWCFSVAQDILTYTLLKECSHKWPRPPPNVVWVIGSSWVHSHLYLAIHLWLDHSGRMLLPGVNSFLVKMLACWCLAGTVFSLPCISAC